MNESENIGSFNSNEPINFSQNVGFARTSELLPALTLSSVKLSRDGITVIVNGDYPTWIRVNKVGSEILDYCDGKHTRDQLVEALSAKYAKDPSEIRKDVEVFLERVNSRHLFDMAPPWKNVMHRALDLMKPTIIVLNVTNKCNLACPYCFQNAGTEYKNELTSDEIKSVITKAIELNPEINISLSGGEPFMRRDLLELLAFACSKAQRVSLLTNGTLITQRVANEIARVKTDGLFVQISIDGGTASTHDAIRGNGSFEKSMTAIRLLEERQIPVVLSFTVTKANMNDVAGFFKLCADNRISRVRIDYVKGVGRATNDKESVCLTDQDFIDVQRMIYKLQTEYGWKYGDPLNDRGILLGSFLKPRVVCGAGISLIFVDADGNVYPCTSLTSRELTGGNIRNQSLQQIVSESPAFKNLRHFDINCIGVCSTCYLKYICNGTCWIDGYAAYNAPAPSPFCNALKQMAEDMILNYAVHPAQLSELAQLQVKQVSPLASTPGD